MLEDLPEIFQAFGPFFDNSRLNMFCFELVDRKDEYLPEHTDSIRKADISYPA